MDFVTTHPDSARQCFTIGSRQGLVDIHFSVLLKKSQQTDLDRFSEKRQLVCVNYGRTKKRDAAEAKYELIQASLSNQSVGCEVVPSRKVTTRDTSLRSNQP